MKDRIPTYPGRVEVTHEDGTKEFVTVKRADEPTQEGTALNKGNLLDDNAAYRCELDGIAATPSNAFSRCAPIALQNAFTDDTGGASDLTLMLQSPTRSANGAADSQHCIFLGGNTRFLYDISPDFIFTSIRNEKYMYGLSCAAIGSHILIFSGQSSSDNSTLQYGRVYDYTDDGIFRDIGALPFTASNSVTNAYQVGSHVFVQQQYIFSNQNGTYLLAYTEDLVRTQIFHEYRSGGLMVPFRNNLILAGGYSYNGTSTSPNVYAFDEDLVRTSLPNLTITNSINVHGGSNGAYLIINIGNAGTSSTWQNLYNADFVQSIHSNGLFTYIGDSSTYNGHEYLYFLYSYAKTNIVTIDQDLLHKEHTRLGVVLPEFENVNGLVYAYLSDLVLFQNYLLLTGYHWVYTGSSKDDNHIHGFCIGKTVDFTIPALSSYRFEGMDDTEKQALESKHFHHDGAITGYIRRGLLLENQIAPF